MNFDQEKYQLIREVGIDIFDSYGLIYDHIISIPEKYKGYVLLIVNEGLLVITSNVT